MSDGKTLVRTVNDTIIINHEKMLDLSVGPITVASAISEVMDVIEKAELDPSPEYISAAVEMLVHRMRFYSSMSEQDAERWSYLKRGQYPPEQK